MFNPHEQLRLGAPFFDRLSLVVNDTLQCASRQFATLFHRKLLSDRQNRSIGGVTRHSDNAKTYGLDGGVGLATRNISPSYEQLTDGTLVVPGASMLKATDRYELVVTRRGLSAAVNAWATALWTGTEFEVIAVSC